MSWALASLLLGCASYEPRPLDPELEFEALLSRGRTPSTPGTPSTLDPLDVRAPGEPEWFPLQAQVVLHDGLSLDEANALALFHAPRILRARSAERVAGAQVLSAGLLSNPELFAGPRFSTLDGSLILPASLSWKLPLYGEPAAEKGLAVARRDARLQTVLETELDVLGVVREQFVRLAYLTRRLTVLEELQVSSTQVLGWVEDLSRVGGADTATLFLARLQRDEIQAQSARLRSERDRETRRLLERIGLLPDATLSIDLAPDPTRLPEIDAPDRGRLLAHPRLRAALATYESAEQALRLEITRQYPELRLGPEFERTPLEITVGLGLGAELPLFDRNQGAIAEAEELRWAAAADYRDALLSLVHSEAQARADWRSAEELLANYRAGALLCAAEAARALDQRLRAGEANVLEVLTAHQAIAHSRIQELLLNEAETLARLQAATAGGLVLRESAPPEFTDKEK